MLQTAGCCIRSYGSEVVNVAAAFQNSLAPIPFFVKISSSTRQQKYLWVVLNEKVSFTVLFIGQYRAFQEKRFLKTARHGIGRCCAVFHSVLLLHFSPACLSHCSSGHHLRKQIQQELHYSGERKRAVCQHGFSPVTQSDLLRIHQICLSSQPAMLILEPETHSFFFFFNSIFTFLKSFSILVCVVYFNSTGQDFIGWLARLTAM